MRLVLIISVFVAIYSASSFSQVTNEIGKVTCPEMNDGNPFGFCTYTLRNNATRAQLVVTKVQQALFNGIPLVMPIGILAPFGENSSEIIFWHKDETIFKKMKELIPVLDTYEEFNPKKVYHLSFEVHKITKTALTNLSAAITSLTTGIPTTATSPGVNNTGLNLSLQLGAVNLSALINAGRSRGDIETEQTASRVVTNLTSIEYDNTTEIDYAPGAGTQPNIRKVGLQFDGTISQSALDESLLQIRDFHFEYGALRADGYVQRIHVPFNAFFLKEGVSTPVIVDKITANTTNTNIGINGGGYNREKTFSHLLVYITVKSMSWEEYMRSLNSVPSANAIGFSTEEIEKLPSKCPSNWEMLKDLQLISKRDPMGQPVLGIGLKKKYACKKNIQEVIKVKVSSRAIDNKKNETSVLINELMHVPFRIRNIKPDYLERADIEFKLRMEVAGKKVVTRLVYLPKALDISTAFFIK
jgi:hypothetical protein